LDDTVLLADALLDRDGEFSLTYSPKGSGILGLSITSRFGPPATSGSITLGGFVTVITGYEAQQVTMTICNEGDDKYRFGFNGQEKVNEIAGIGNHNTALFWEYDTRLGRRWNLDPKPSLSVSNYAVFGNNPIVYKDFKGDTINIAYSDHFTEDGSNYEISYGVMSRKGLILLNTYLQTQEGYEYAAQFAHKGQIIAGVKFDRDGEFAKNNMYFHEIDLKSQLDITRFIGRTHRGINGVHVGRLDNNGKPEVWNQLMSFSYKKTFTAGLSALGDLGHETFLHGDSDDEAIRAFNRGDKKTYQKLTSSAQGDRDHKAEEQRNTSHPGYKKLAKFLKKIENVIDAEGWKNKW